MAAPLEPAPFEPAPPPPLAAPAWPADAPEDPPPPTVFPVDGSEEEQAAQMANPASQPKEGTLEDTCAFTERT